MLGLQATKFVLDQMQMLNQQITPTRAIAQQRLHLSQRRIVQLTAFGRLAAFAATRFPNAFAIILRGIKR